MGHYRPKLKNDRGSWKCTQLESRDANSIITHVTNASLLQTSRATSVQSRLYKNYLTTNLDSKENTVLTMELLDYL